jgi:ferredoxin
VTLMTICFFSATGNSLYVARRIGGTLLSIPKLMRQETIEIEDDSVGIVSPVYVGGMPLMVQEFLKRAEIRTDYFFYIFTCGNGGSFSQVQTIAHSRGLPLKYGAIIRMVDNFLPVFEMQQEVENLVHKDVEGQLRTVCRDIASGAENLTAESKAQAHPFMNMFAKKVLRRDAAQSYIVNEQCIHCGICAKVCPADNITVTDEEVSFSDRCEVCYACVHNCPQNAIHLRKEKSAARFRNEHVSLNDIMEANGSN